MLSTYAWGQQLGLLLTVQQSELNNQVSIDNHCSLYNRSFVPDCATPCGLLAICLSIRKSTRRWNDWNPGNSHIPSQQRLATQHPPRGQLVPSQSAPSESALALKFNMRPRRSNSEVAAAAKSARMGNTIIR